MMLSKRLFSCLFLGALTLVSVLGSNSAEAYENRCRTRSRETVRPSVCLGRSIPANRTRNFAGQQLECTGNADYYLRRPQRFDYMKWSDLRKEDPKKAYELRRQVPDIAWAGEIPYQTVETWRWDECTLGANGAECGWDRECSTTTVYESECTSNSDGSQNCRSVPRQVETCVDVPRTCWHDVTRYEAWPCSAERMKFTAAYRRPTPQEWNLQTHPYAEFLPNKYDLMPGEKEVVQIFNNDSQSTQLNPRAVVGEAWNKYAFRITGSGVGAQCRQNSNYAINVVVDTIERDTRRESPNAFTLARDFRGDQVDPLVWVGGAVRGKTIEKGTPIKLRLADASATVVGDIAEHSRNAATRERLKLQTNRTGNTDSVSVGSRSGDNEGFFKATQVRVRLYKVNSSWFDRYESGIISDDVRSATASNNFLSEDQEIALSDLWDIDLTTGNDLYRGGWAGLRKNRVYDLRVSMYQRGVPFYKQSCEDQPGFLGSTGMMCRVFRGDHFSKPLNVRFNTDASWDTRNWFRRFSDSPFHILDYLGEQLVHQRPDRSGGGN